MHARRMIVQISIQLVLDFYTINTYNYDIENNKAISWRKRL